MRANPSFMVVVHYSRGQTTAIDFRAYDDAVKFAKARASVDDVARIEIVHDHRIVWTDGSGMVGRQRFEGGGRIP